MSEEISSPSPLSVAETIAAGGVQSTSAFGISVQNVDISKLIELEKFKTSKTAATNPAGALRSVPMEGGSTRW